MKSAAALKHSLRQSTDSEVGRHRSSKDTKRWCGGKVGLGHDFQWGEDRDHGHRWQLYGVRSEVRCTRCKKRRGGGETSLPGGFRGFDAYHRPRFGPAY